MIGCGYSKYLSDMDQELKNQYPLPSGGCAVLFAALCVDLAGQPFGRIPVCDCYGLCNRPWRCWYCMAGNNPYNWNGL